MQDVDVPVVIVRVDSLMCAIPCAAVVETMRRLPVTPLDGMPAFAAGLATVRGESVPVLDLALLLGRPSAGSRFVTVRADHRTVVLLVDEVVGVARFDATELAGRPPLLTEAAAPLVQALARKDRQVYLLLNATRLVEQAPV